MYCQACGAENTEDARFCNMCGSRFARAGEAGGPIAAEAKAPAEAPAPADGPRNDPNATVLGVGKAEVAASAPPAVAPGAVAPGAALARSQQSPFGSDSMLGVTLGGIGVQSAKKAWITVLGIAALLVAVGAIATWLAMRGGDESGGHAEADDPFVLGMPLTEETERVPEDSVEGDPTPEDIDFVTGRSGGTRSGGTAGSAMGGTSDPPSTMRRASGSSGGSTAMSSAGGSSAGGSTGGGSSAGGSTGGGSSAGSAGGSTGGGSGAGGGSAGGSSTMEPDTDETGSSGGSSGGTGSLPTNTETAPEERDLELELYGSRVRYVVRRYYAGRAQNCFERATRNDPSVSGTVVIAMTIGAEGEVTRARVQRNTTGNESLGNCLSSQVGTWRLPPPPGGSLDMTMPFSR